MSFEHTKHDIWMLNLKTTAISWHYVPVWIQLIQGASAFWGFFFFFWRRAFHVKLCFSNGSRALLTRLTNTLFQKKKNFKTKFHSTIHTFKNYFATMSSVFSKISGIQTDPITQNFNLLSFLFFFFWLLIISIIRRKKI